MSPRFRSPHWKLLLGLGLVFIVGGEVWAASPEAAAAAKTFLWVAILLLLAKISGLIERLGQAAVLGELLVGMLLGNLYLAGIDIVEPVKTDAIIVFLAELGVVILLFQIGLESNIAGMRKVGVPAMAVALIGVVVPFVLGTYFIGPWLLPGLSANSYLFLGATLTATSVGITGRVFRDLNVLQSSEAQIVLGAAVIDDVLGLIILAVVSAIAATGEVGVADVGWITLKALLFLVGAIVIGQRLAPLISHWLSKVHTGGGMKFSILIAFCLTFAWLAHLIGLAPIVGAFAAGLILDNVQFRDFAQPALIADIRHVTAGGNSATAQRVRETLARHEKHNLEVLIEPVGYFFVPLFFVFAGMQVRLDVFFDPAVVATAVAITVAAFAGKIVAGVAAGPVNKWIVGWGMAPRGEVGLIFAVTGKALGVVNDEIFSVIVAVVVLTTLLTPPVLTTLIRRAARRGG
jgi:Kef-type K+ transport system membrane component KefB